VYKFTNRLIFKRQKVKPI